MIKKKVTLTGSPVVTTPISLTTLGWLNCPLMAASWRNLTFSCSEAPGWSCLTATSMAPIGLSQTPLFTVPNSPDPNTPVSLKDNDVNSLIFYMLWLILNKS